MGKKQGYKRIKLTRGKVAIVDEDDFERLCGYSWHYEGSSKKQYASRKIYVKGTYKIGKKQKTIRMHTDVMGVPPKGYVIDHINGNSLDNRKSNLRICLFSQNAKNQKNRTHYKGKKCSSIYKGVSWHKKSKKWIAYIMVDYKCIYLGTFSDEKEAGKEYNKNASIYFGEFARLNKI